MNTLPPLQAQQQLQQLPDSLGQLVTDLVLIVPRLIGAFIVLLIGWFVGRLIARLVRTVVDRAEIDRWTLRTPLGNVLGGTESAVSSAFGKLAAYYVYFLAVLAAANVLNIPLLSAWIADAASYLPAFIAGLVIIVVGFIVADFVGDVIERTSATTQERYTAIMADGVRMFLYFIVVVLALDTMQVDVEILYIFAAAVAGGLGLALAIGLGIAFGLGARGYVAENIDRWAGGARAGMSNEPASGDD